MQWTAAQSVDKFQALSRDIFRRRNTNSSIFGRIQELLLSYAKDAQYNQDAITGAFSKAGTVLKMFNPIRSHTRVAVTSTTAKGTRACLFTNYNGPSQQEDTKPISYDIMRAHKAELDVTVSEA